MKALARIEANHRSRQLDSSEESLGGLASKFRASGNLSLLLRFERFDPLLFGASNSLCTKERERLTNTQFAELQSLVATLSKREDEST
jgi:hypothetical protein